LLAPIQVGAAERLQAPAIYLALKLNRLDSEFIRRQHHQPLRINPVPFRDHARLDLHSRPDTPKALVERRSQTLNLQHIKRPTFIGSGSGHGMAWHGMA